MNLERYLNQYLGQPIGKLAVTSAIGTPGFVQKVEWNNFPSSSHLSHEIDIENSWVTIWWDNGNRDGDTVDTVDNMTHVTVKENT